MKRTSCVKIALVLLILTLTAAAITAKPTLAHHPGPPQTLCVEAYARAGSVSASSGYKEDAAANHVGKQNALEAKAGPVSDGAGNSAQAKVKIWVEYDGSTKVVPVEINVHASGSNAEAWAYADPDGAVVRQHLPNGAVLDTRGGTCYVENKVTDQGGTRERDKYTATLTPTSFSTTGTWGEWKPHPTLNRKGQDPFSKSYSDLDGISYVYQRVSVSGGRGIASTAMPVGGIAISTDKLAILAPLLILGVAIPVSIATIAVYKRKRKA